MFKKTITWEDFNGEKQTQSFYFHISKADMLDMIAGGEMLLDRLQRIIDTKDNRAILKEFKAFVDMSAGVRSEDGSQFIQTPEAKGFLMNSPAYDELLMELCTQADKATEFIQNLFPKKMQEEMRAQIEKMASTARVDGAIQNYEQDAPAWMKENRDPTQTELSAMTPAELQAAFRHRIEKKNTA